MSFHQNINQTDAYTNFQQQQHEYYAAMVMAAANFENTDMQMGGWGSYPGSPFFPMSNANQHQASDLTSANSSFNQRGYFSAPNTPTWPAGPHSHTNMGINPTFAAGQQTTFHPYPQPTQQPTKKYTHNPYASEPTTPTHVPQRAAAQVFSMESPTHPVYAASAGLVGAAEMEVPHTVAHSIADQYAQCIGSLAATACSPRGRHLLLSVIRLQHLDKITQIFEELLPSLWMLVNDSHGCHVLRFLVEYLTDAQVDQFVQCFTRDMILQLATSSQHTRRILQTLYEHHSNNAALQYFTTTLCEECYTTATTQQGCIALMRVLENAAPAGKMQMLTALTPCLAVLSMDPFGNYVVQTVLQQFERNVLGEMLESAFDGQWVTLACNKFGSNVMEKAVTSSTPQLRNTILRELCFRESNLQVIMQDGYGNFVLQALIEVAAGTPEGKRLCDLVRPLLHASPYGHKIEAKLKAKKYLGNAASSANVPIEVACAPQQQQQQTHRGRRHQSNNNHDGPNCGSTH